MFAGNVDDDRPRRQLHLLADGRDFSFFKDDRPPDDVGPDDRMNGAADQSDRSILRRTGDLVVRADVRSERTHAEEAEHDEQQTESSKNVHGSHGGYSPSFRTPKRIWGERQPQ